ncbi:MAG: UDP-N-acetyl-D-glucosamine dehydrogenase [Candidatus Neomarinimicrobiota bacterium]|nr:MAG: UDP-N-acetyl-D-glucosamine dehydrogenase [Candidatus Neomarinimicrobiota bacterium]
MDLREKIKNKSAKVGIIGLGYVGLPLAMEFAKEGFSVVGIDVSREKVDKLNQGENYIIDVNDNDLKWAIEKRLFRATTDYSVIKDVDAISICVPTPLRKTKDPDVSFIIAATEELAKFIHKDLIIILESTTYPGTTRELVLPILERSGLKVGRDFYLAFSPERVDPGNPIYKTKNTPKVLGGITKSCTEMAKLLYEQIIEKVVPVSSTESAEMVKLLENTFRSINIGLANEMALMCDRLGVDVWEIIEAAGTKPFGFMKFYPGPGLGGHCIPIDPFYLSWKMKLLNYNAKFIELAGEINSSMPEYVVTLVADGLNMKRKTINGSKVLIIGVSYKKDIDDTRESPALDVMKLLEARGANLEYHDPFVERIVLNGKELRSVDIGENKLKSYDAVVIITDHSNIDYQMIQKYSSIVVDTRNAIKGRYENVLKLGARRVVGL